MYRSMCFLWSLISCGVLSASGPEYVFIPNLGQWEGPHVQRADLGGLSLFLEVDRLTWALLEPDAGDLVHEAIHHDEATVVRGHSWQVVFEGANEVVPKTVGRSPYHLNYFLGSDRTRWRGNVHAASELVLPELWQGVDLRLHTDDGHFKYDLIVAPEADLDQVGFRYRGTEGVRIDENGRLVVATTVGDLIEDRPVAWYADGAREPLTCGYRLDGEVLHYTLNGADRSRPIVIDPTLIASTLSGATGSSNYGHCATFDDAGNIYTGARNFGPSYPATIGAFQTTMGGGGTDISISKYTPDGSNLVWASYLGGSSGENPHSLIVTSNEELCLLGSTQSADFPTTPGAFDNTYNGNTDITVTVFNGTGSALLGSTYLGGSGNDGNNSMFANYGEAYRGEIVLDLANTIHVADFTQSSDFPTTTGVVQTALAGGQDGVVCSFDLTCSNLLYSTFLGGAQDDNVMAIRVEDNGELLVTGATESSDFPMAVGGLHPTYIGGARDGYVLRLSPGGTAVLNGTFYGTTDEDRSYFLDTDNQGDVWIYGQTDGALPIQPAGTFGTAGGDIFIAQLDPSLSSLMVQSTLGNGGGFSSSTVPVAFLLDVCDHIYVSGYNSATSLPTTPDALYTSGSFYLAAFDVDMSGQLFGTYYGGSHVDGGTSRFDKNGIIYQGVCSGTGSLQTTPWAWSTNQTIGWDIGVFKIDFQVAGVNISGTVDQTQGCVPFDVLLSGSGNAQSYIWDFGDGSGTVVGTNVGHTFQQPGTYEVMLVGIDSNTCNLADTSFITVQVNAPGGLDAGFLVAQTSDCSQIEVVATDTTIGGGLVSNWDMGDGTLLTGSTVYHVYNAQGTYGITLTVIDTLCGDTSVAVLPITVDDEFAFDIGPDETICPGQSLVLDAGITNASYLWSTNQTTQTISVDQPGSYWVQVDVNGCNGADTLVVGMFPPPGEMDSFQEVCPGEPVTIAIPIEGNYVWDVGGTTQAITVDTLGIYTFTVTDLYGCTWTGQAVVAPDPDDFEVLVPNVISPNGDGSNDRFEPQTGGPKDVEVAIYNRWGMEMFSHPNLGKLWDGRHDGNVVPEGTYFYIVKYRPSCQDEKVVKTGHVTVLR